MSRMRLLLPLVVLVGILAWFSTPMISNFLSGQKDGNQGRALITASFNLVNVEGEKVTQKDFHGKPMLVYFGFTYCPDVCPTELMRIGQFMDALGRDADKIHPILISVDPDRDTPQAMQSYLKSFHPAIIGLTGTPENIKDAASSFRVFYSKAEDPGSNAGYLIDHSAFVYLMDKNGEYLAHFSPQTDFELMLQRIKKSFSS